MFTILQVTPPLSIFTGDISSSMPTDGIGIVVFCCQAIVAIPKAHQNWKLSPASAEGILLGYENNNTSHCVPRMSNSKVIISQHVIFDEVIFPSLDSKLSNLVLIIPEDGPAAAVVVDEPHPADMELVDEVQPMEPELNDTSRMVD
ncbi:hypothetical protein O181_037672 [Austropuccinia psidii MF-1]|uniref:Retroviral polymerase SH3-like domain-containing protein n=1 Tax=Austropuccinia psidii MF-1 TaxID=1389203 RepID=A0A9Q3DD76_9BASI|nr:hypothetical protein [Austropuccinia psidii MF-1]